MVRKRNIRVPLIGIALLLLVVAVACGTSSTATSPPPPATAPATVIAPATVAGVAPTAVPTATTAPADDTPAGAGRLRVAAALEREVNHPFAAVIDAWIQAGPVFEGLVEEPPDLDYRPMLATTWTKSQDGKSWTFNLRKGVPFHYDWGNSLLRM